MINHRHLEWDGCVNARDLGGLPTADGRTTRWGAIVRADAPHQLTASGWSAVHAHGIRTVIDLRCADERQPDLVPRPADLETVHLPLEDYSDSEFWDRWRPLFHTPLSYQPFLHHFPDRMAAVIAVVARARPGGVLIHCAAGRDRTGLVSLVLLALAGVSPELIADDHDLSHARLRPLLEQLGRSGEEQTIHDHIAREGTTARESLLSTVTSVDFDTRLHHGGLSPTDLAAVRARLVGCATVDAKAVDACL
ncbi:protein-tyrosine-phosphatase [Longimycelium tulufanense]|uniref:Protein-tyrosine-phosphatase n=1 Tax=Longimycelium tulufanense TaxID=907463 RepID=A0A8J3FX65_9PSEU|nr:tyrosine-protein phosphatase [Longimycelium tulufanense]GGM83758.1 protein-tyrosine-phosphatase [Longimycelium tulufanense]